MKHFFEKNHKIAITIILGFMAIVSLLNAWNDSAIFDETAHIGAAYSYVDQHEIRLNPEHPPLIKDLAGLPLLLLHPNFNVVGQPFWTGNLPGKWDEGQWAAGRYLLYQSGNDPDQIIFWARFPIVILSLILGWFIFRWSKEMAGTLAGIIALTLYAFDPNILGHNHFVTTDLGIAAFFTFAFYFYFNFIKHPSWKNVFLAGLFLGLLFSAKFSFLVAFPIIGFATIIYPFVVHSPETGNKLTFRLKKFGEYMGKGALIFILALIVVWGLYAANTFNMSKETIAQSIDNNFSPSDTSNVKNVYTNKTLHWLNDHPISRPYTEFGIGVAYVFRRVSGGNGAYFMEQVSSQAFRAYFPTVFAIKEPVPALFLMMLALLLSLWKIISTFRKTFDDFLRKNLRNISNFLRTHIAEFSLFLFIFLYAYISVNGNLNIGFRHLFPILPFIYILTARNIANFLKNKAYRHKALASYEHNSKEALQLTRQEIHEEQRIRIFSIAFAALLGYLILGTIFAYPYYMSYFNETVGGSKNGYHYVTDSNADWGQDLKRLQNFLDSHPEIDRIRVDYFGGGDTKTYIGDKYLQWWDSKRPIESGWYAVSTNFLMGSLYDKIKPDNQSYRWLQNKKPAHQVGTSILIYYITPEEALTYNK